MSDGEGQGWRGTFLLEKKERYWRGLPPASEPKFTSVSSLCRTLTHAGDPIDLAGIGESDKHLWFPLVEVSQKLQHFFLNLLFPLLHLLFRLALFFPVEGIGELQTDGAREVDPSLRSFRGGMQVSPGTSRTDRLCILKVHSG